jgi:hypothetical protein
LTVPTPAFSSLPPGRFRALPPKVSVAAKLIRVGDANEPKE